MDKGRLYLVYIILLTLIANISLVNAQSINYQIENDGSILLPAEKNKSISTQKVIDTKNNPGWNNFIETNGKWTISIDKSTGMPHRAFGKAIKISGYNSINKNNVEEAAMSFLREHASLFNINTNNLRLRRATEKNGRWYVSYYQEYQGLKVLLSEVELRIFSNGNVMAFGVDYYNNIKLSTDPSISLNTAMDNASDGLIYKPGADQVQSKGDTYILPVKHKYGVDCRLVYEVKINTGRLSGDYITYVDAHSGNIVWRRNLAFNAATDIVLSGGIKTALATEEQHDAPFPFMDVQVGDEKYTSSADGTISLDTDEAADFTVGFSGPWANVFIKDGTSSSFSSTITPGEDVNILWDDENSTIHERMLFYHTNVVHEYVKSIDPEMTCMDFPIDVEIELNGQQPNAMSQGRQIRFLAVNNSDYLFSQSPSVLYHEYGHSLNTLLYQDLGAQSQMGMENYTCQEGMADLMAGLILDTPYMGHGVFVDDSLKTMRVLKNDIIYPDSMQSDGHYNGQVLSGAFWDLREEISLDYAASLSHFAKYGLPDDPDDGIALSEWFIETLIADDDDGDLSNGTPNSGEIVRAFNRHGIGTNLFMRLSFEHEPLSDTKDTINPYIVEFALEGVSALGITPDSVSVWYSKDNFKSSERIMAEMYENGKYRAEVPAQAGGTMLKYYISTWDVFGESNINLDSYDFLIGYTTAFYNDFEEQADWTIGSDDDNASSGVWEIGEPNRIDMTMMQLGIIQPGRDHSENGTKCFVTGASGDAMSFYMHMLTGRSTITSPEYDLADLKNPVLRYYKWFVRKGLMGPTEAVWQLDVSGDGGETWVNIETLEESTDEWERSQYLISDYLDNASSIKFRIVADNPTESGGQQMPPLCEALLDDFEILSAGPPAVSPVGDDYSNTGFYNYPNPFNMNTNICFNNDLPCEMSLIVYDVFGKEVRSITQGSYPAGAMQVNWDGLDNDGKKAVPGVYIIKLQTGESIKTLKVNLF